MNNIDLINMAINQKDKAKAKNTYINLLTANYIINNVDSIETDEQTKQILKNVIEDNSKTYEDKLIHIVLYNGIVKPKITLK